MFKNIVFVCTGNICRSPMAEYLFKQQIKNHSSNIQVSSAGTHALNEHPISMHSATLLKMENLNCDKHKSRQLTKCIINTADLILVMENFHQYNITSKAIESRGKVFLLGHWDAMEIPDPFQKDFAFYKEVMLMIKQGLGSWGKKLKDL